MKNGLVPIFLFGLFLAVSGEAGAATVRYALIVGNNTGVDSDGSSPFTALRYAEKEAEKLKQKLVGLANFTADSKRTLLLTGATRADVKKAIARIARQRRADAATLGDMDAIFLFYFTGHGLQGRLLMEDGPLYASELGRMFEQVDADFAVGVFDACHSGSLSPKGVVSTPGFNMFSEMPKEVLNARGRIWYVSSGARQVSYEDTRLGGVFTHFFIRALTEAPRSGPGITLDSIWNYAREKTVQYTRKQNRTQEPQQYISELKSSAPVFFSFPLERTASLEMSKELHGQFVLSYADGQLTELIEKRAGARKKVPLYPGEVTLSYVDGDTITFSRSFYVENGGELVLHRQSELNAATPLAYSSDTLWSKGMDDLQTIELRQKHMRVSMLIGGSYSYSYTANGLLSNGHMVSMPLRLDFPRFYLGMRSGWMGEDRDSGVWGYDADSLTVSVEGGPAVDIYSSRLAIGLDVEYMHVWQEFNDASLQQSNSVGFGGKATWLFHKDRRFNAAVFLRAGATWAKAASASREHFWGMSLNAGLNLYVRTI